MIIILLMVCFAVLCHTLMMFLLANVLGFKVEEFGIGIGFRLRKISSKYGEIIINTLPIGNYIKFDENDFKNKSKIKQTLVILSGCVFVIVVGKILMIGNHSVMDVVGGMVNLIIYPKTFGISGLEYIVGLIKTNWLLCLGVVFTYVGIMNISPLCFMNGGDLLKMIIPILREGVCHTAFAVISAIIAIYFLVVHIYVLCLFL